MAEKIAFNFNLDLYIKEMIDERSATMEDGRDHLAVSEVSSPQVEEKAVGPDDGDDLG